jgi:hypothetical protein
MALHTRATVNKQKENEVAGHHLDKTLKTKERSAKNMRKSAQGWTPFARSNPVSNRKAAVTHTKKAVDAPWTCMSWKSWASNKQRDLKRPSARLNATMVAASQGPASSPAAASASER